MKSLLKFILLLALVIVGKLAKQPGALPTALNQSALRPAESVQTFFARQVNLVNPNAAPGQGRPERSAVSVN
ncbi:hypothetical protein [Hymenobacter sp. B81]|uniref:hypothetical protein n=1 Tax=Hymenobacter sp. B81 TaxID=3344878 RepID=UPI0037DCC74C